MKNKETYYVRNGARGIFIIWRKIPNDSAIEYTRTYKMKRPSNIGG